MKYQISVVISRPSRLFQVMAIFHPFGEQQRAGDHEKKRHADVAEDRDKSLEGGIPQGNGLKFRLLVVVVVIGAVHRVVQGDGQDGHRPGQV